MVKVNADTIEKSDTITKTATRNSGATATMWTNDRRNATKITGYFQAIKGSYSGNGTYTIKDSSGTTIKTDSYTMDTYDSSGQVYTKNFENIQIDLGSKIDTYAYGNYGSSTEHRLNFTRYFNLVKSGLDKDMKPREIKGIGNKISLTSIGRHIDGSRFE